MFFAICTLAALRLSVAPVHTQAPTAPVIGPEPAPVLRPVDDVVQRLLEQYSIPGAVVGIVRDGRLVFIRGYGYANAASKTGVELDSQFRIASVTKPLTATAILKLEEQGKLSLDSLAFDILRPAVPVADPRIFEITVRHLLEHKGGWDRDGTGYDPMFRDQEVSASVGKPLPIQCPDIIQHMMGRMLDFAPGSKSSYSNFGYCVLGQLIEKVSGVSYDQYVRDNILMPLDMTRTQLGASARERVTPHEVTYVDYPNAPLVRTVLDSSGKLVPDPYGGFSLEAMMANGGWISSVADILRFGSAESGARPPSVLANPPPGFPTYVPPTELGWGWYFNGALPGTAAVLVVDNRDISGHRTDFCVLMNSWPLGDVHGAMRTGILDVLKNVGVNDWPSIDLFRSRFEPSDALVELLSDGSPGSKLSQTLPVQMKGDPVPIDIQADTNAPWLSAGAPSSFAPTNLTIGVRPDATLAVGDYYAWVTVSAQLAENRFRVRVHLRVPSLPPSVPASLTLSPTSVKGGSPSEGTVRLDRPAPAGGTVVTLKSSNPAALVPAQVIVAPGGQSASFTVVSHPVSTSTAVTITAMAASVTKQATLTVLAPVLDRLAFPASIVASEPYNYYSYAVFLDAPAPSTGVVVKLASSAPMVAAVPASVTVPAGALGQSFSGTITWVRADTPVTFTATSNGVTKQATMTVRGTSPVRISLGQNPITGGYSTWALVGLVTCYDGSVLNLASSNTAVATLPRTVKVYRWGCGSYVEIKTKRVGSPATVTITASYGSDKAQAMLSVLPRVP